MNDLRVKIKRMWQYYWKDDDKDCSVTHLSQSDKRLLFYGAFMICMFTLIISSLGDLRVSKKNSEGMEKIVGMVATYIGSATDSEYEEVAKSIRHDLVFSEYGQEIDTFIQYIPNTADGCQICMVDLPAQAYFVCTNTGELYVMDLYEKDEDVDKIKSNNITMDFGYDEISQTSIDIEKSPRQGEETVSFRRGRGIVSVQKMKAIFCDECIRKLLNAVENQPMKEFVIYDVKKKSFHPIALGKDLQIGSYSLDIEFKDGYEIAIKYIEE